MSLVVVGAGGHAKVVIATARATGREVVAVFDDDIRRIGSNFMGVRIEGPVNSIRTQYPDAEVVLAIGDNRTRKEINAMLDGPFATLIHPFTWIAPDVALGPGTVVFAGTVVQVGTRVGTHCVLNTSCSVDHDCLLGDYSQVAPGARLAGTVELQEGAYLGMNACAIQNLSVGAWAVVGAGAAVIRDVPEGHLVKGVPAR